jgi:DNA-binding transcriptional LysR family regulator
VSTALSTVDVDRLGKLLRLALVADEDGEILAALCALKRALSAVGLDAHWLADTVERGTKSVALPPTEDRPERDDRSAAWFAFHRRDLLSPKERAFIENIVERSAPLSPKQRQWLYDLVDRLEAA